MDFKEKKVLIFGLGLNQGGVGSAKFFAKNGSHVRVTDLKSKELLQPSLDLLRDFPDIEYVFGEHRNEDIDWADLIIKNPSVKPGNEFIEYSKKIGKRVEMDMGIFLEYVKPSQIIGVTGTKGKSTTASLIYQALSSSNLPVILAGNIGISVLDTIDQVTPETIVILELSSFNLESFDRHQVSPKWAVITNITPDHLNYYQTMDEYIRAKNVIGKYQSQNDFIFLRRNDPVTSKKQFTENFKGKIDYFSLDDLPQDFEPNIKGEHNLLNIAAALKVSDVFGIGKTFALKILSNFSGVPFRQQLIKTWRGVKIINDTTSTGPDAGIKALMSYPDCILIAGGMNKNMPYDEYAKIFDEKVKKAFFLEGDSTELIKGLTKRSDKIMGTYNNLEQLLTDVKRIVQSGDVVLFSPAATSFNLFQNEFDRGRKFNKLVEQMFK
ncbi:UDP-N-acetylmuramoyl-L-alanine--D-glutamate ligase [Candidatus Daviesbacteria bacterium]|nr:UDP-N-acetylmuramoyl-L-alanine--D-glutamate ligase [Candidatus Daviesbacteria bacterium]